MSLPPPTGLPQPPAPQRTFCYRHPTRDAGRRCTRCGRPACDDCLVRADIGSQCVECARKGRPATTTRARDWSARQPVLVTYSLMAINIAVFVWMVARDAENLNPGGSITQEQADFALAERVLVRTTTGTVELIDITDQWYRLVSSGFLHYGFIHLAFNMFMLFQLGQLLEPVLGRVRFGLLYFASMLGGSAGALLVQPNGLHGGASGAVFGLFGAAAVLMLRRGINPLTTGVGTAIVLNVFITFTIPGISVGGHLGGLLAGAAAGSLMSAPRYGGRQPEWVTYAAPIAVGIVAIAVAYLATRP
jgi:membrane associated rhomboid family serine protease